MTAAREAAVPDRDETWFAIAALRLRAASLWTQRDDLRNAAPGWHDSALDVLEASRLDDAARARCRADLDLQAGRFRLAVDEPEAAVPLLEHSLACAGGDPGPVLLSLCDAYRRCRRVPDALDAAQRALDSADSSGQPDDTRLAASGRLVQLKLVSSDHEGALADARAGLALAVAVDNVPERATFQQDAARALVRLRRFAEAAAAARQARALACQLRDDRRDLSAIGCLGQALLGAGDLEAASQAIEEGIATAQALRDPREEGDFRIDLCDLNLRRGDPAAAMEAAIAAVPLFVGIRDMARVRNGLGKGVEALNALVRASAQTPAVWLKALVRKASFELSVFRAVAPDIQAAIANEGAARFGRVCEEEPGPAFAPILAALAGLAGTILAERDDNPPALAFLTQTYRAYAALAAGDMAGARIAAVAADKVSNGGTMVAALVNRAATRHQARSA